MRGLVMCFFFVRQNDLILILYKSIHGRRSQEICGEFGEGVKTGASQGRSRVGRPGKTRYRDSDPPQSSFSPARRWRRSPMSQKKSCGLELKVAISLPSEVKRAPQAPVKG